MAMHCFTVRMFISYCRGPDFYLKPRQTCMKFV